MFFKLLVLSVIFLFSEWAGSFFLSCVPFGSHIMIGFL